MKKIYSKPEVLVVKLKIQTLLLPVSNTVVENGLSRRGRGNDIWDDEDDED